MDTWLRTPRASTEKTRVPTTLPSILMGPGDFHRIRIKLDAVNGRPGCPMPFLGLLLLFLTPVGLAEFARDKPETMLLDFLSKPFAPSDGVSLDCLRDSTFYLRELDRYTPWALRSKFCLCFSFSFSYFLFSLLFFLISAMVFHIFCHWNLVNVVSDRVCIEFWDPWRYYRVRRIIFLLFGSFCH